MAREAAADLERIADDLLQHAPGMRNASCALSEASATLPTFPDCGRMGKKEGTREFAMLPFPCIVVYDVRGDAVYLVRILHGAQQRP